MRNFSMPKYVHLNVCLVGYFAEMDSYSVATRAAEEMSTID